jgi:hypothetical protein
VRTYNAGRTAPSDQENPRVNAVEKTSAFVGKTFSVWVLLVAGY